MPCREADLEQAAAPVIGNAALLGAQAVCCEAAFEGYGWYDRLPRIIAIDFTFEHGGESWAYGDGAAELLPVGMASGRVSNLHLDLTITPSGGSDARPEVRTFDIGVLAAGNDAYSLDDAIILIGAGAKVELGELVDLMERALFCSSDDCDSDSWETQHRYFVSEARNIAATLLFGEEEALIVALRIPTKPPPRSEKIAPPYSEMMSPPRERGLSGIDRFGFVLGRRQAVGFVFRRRILSPSRFSRWALWTRRSRMASA